MTADTAVVKPEIEEKCGLDVSAYQDLHKVGADCNEISHVDDVVDSGRDDSDGSYEFVGRSDEGAAIGGDPSVKCDAEESYVVANCNGDSVKDDAAKMVVENCGISGSSVEAGNCSGDETDVAKVIVGNGDFVQSSGDEGTCGIDEVVENRETVLSSSDERTCITDEAHVGKTVAENGKNVLSSSDKGTCIVDEAQVGKIVVEKGENVLSSLDEGTCTVDEAQAGKVTVENGETVQSSSDEGTSIADEAQTSKFAVENGETAHSLSDKGTRIADDAQTSKFAVENGETVHSSSDKGTCIAEEGQAGKLVENGETVHSSSDKGTSIAEEGQAGKLVENGETVQSSSDEGTCIADEVQAGEIAVEKGETVQFSDQDTSIADKAQAAKSAVENGETVHSCLEEGTCMADEGQAGKLLVENGEMVKLSLDDAACIVDGAQFGNGEIFQSSVEEKDCIVDGKKVIVEDEGTVQSSAGGNNLIADETEVGKIIAENGNIGHTSRDDNNCVVDGREILQGIVDNGKLLQPSGEKNDCTVDETDTPVTVVKNCDIVQSSVDENDCTETFAAEMIVEYKETAQLHAEESDSMAVSESIIENGKASVVEDGDNIQSLPDEYNGSVDEMDVVHTSADKTNCSVDESMESQRVVSEAVGEIKANKQSYIEWAKDIEESPESGPDEVDNGDEKPGEISKEYLDNDEFAKVEGTPEFQLIGANYVEPSSNQLSDGDEEHEQTNKIQLAVDETSREVEAAIGKCESMATTADGMSSEKDESGGSFPAAPVDCTTSEQLEDFPARAADDFRSETAVKNVKDNFPSCPANDAESEIDVQSSPVVPKSMSTSPAKLVSSGIRFGSIDLDEDSTSFQSDDVQSEYEAEDYPNSGDQETGSKVLDGCVANNGRSLSPVVDAENVRASFNGVVGGTDDKLVCQEIEEMVAIPRDAKSTSLPGNSSTDTADGQSVTKPLHWLIRVPRFDDEKLKEQIRHAQVQVDEKTQLRDVIRAEVQINRSNCQALGESFEAAKSEERAARRSVKLKRQEIDSVQSVINRVKNAISVEDIDGRIHTMEHMIQHETLPLKEEKQFIHEIKRLKHLRGQLSSNMGSQDEIQEALDQKDQIEERLKILKKELDALKDSVSKAEGASVAAGKKYDDESKRVKEFQAKFRAADDTRQEAYAHLLSLKRLLFEKNKYFRMYKDVSMAVSNYTLRGDRASFPRLCANEMETMMELIIKNEDFRKEYVKCNVRSTVRRFRTLDGRSLAPDEEPVVLPSYLDERVGRSVSSSGKGGSSTLISTVEQVKQVSPAQGEAGGKFTEMVAENNNQSVKSEKTVKPIPESGLASVSGRDETGGRKEEENAQSKEEQELARKAEELRKEEMAAKLKEQRRLAEKAKAKEALERKKRHAEKAQIRAELRAQKEAEQKEKEREKRLRKKEKKKAPEAQDDTNDGETAPTTEVLSEAEVRDSPTTVTKRSAKPSSFGKQSKAKPIPPPLRNKGKRKWRDWAFLAIMVALVVVLLSLGSSGFFQNLREQGEGASKKVE
ncbi:hypothetical protein RJ640_020650 [Escallonia rubra]|uniref:Proton pump-interactor 1 n=1 Tax=Escallonia rubra TaxID=112253 RepID=A0AA88UNZ7_9ASTE|nr:hypothetical protein RJ640_020650 [Escallonia rubra]